jgi:hypothetical protein
MSNIQTHLLHVTHFKDVKAAVAYDQVRSLPEIASDILGASAAAKKDLPWIKMARFGQKRSGGNSLRHNDNVKSFSGIELDYDGEKISFNAALAKLQDLHCRGLIYTSPSHTKAKPRWRLLLPTSQEIWEPEFRRVLVNRVDGFFGKIFAQESYTLSQAYFFGRVKHKPKVRCVVVDGDYINLRDDLAMFDDPKPPPPDSDMVAAMVRDAGKGVSNNPADNRIT